MFMLMFEASLICGLPLLSIPFDFARTQNFPTIQTHTHTHRHTVLTTTTTLVEV